jgi:hypothetical protein
MKASGALPIGRFQQSCEGESSGQGEHVPRRYQVLGATCRASYARESYNTFAWCKNPRSLVVWVHIPAEPKDASR